MYIDYLCNNTEYVEVVSKWIYDEFVLETEKCINKLEEIVEYFGESSSTCFPVTFIAVENNECIGTVSIFENDLKTQSEWTPWLASFNELTRTKGESIWRLKR